jgi:2'-5' RNA ligase
MHPLILTLRLDPASFARLDGLRRAHFPPDRNVVPAHVTLFHALPGDREPEIREQIRDLAAMTPAVPLQFPGVRFLGKGVAVEVDAPELRSLRNRLARDWDGWLTPQDRQGYRPHVTVQNKAAKEDARRLFEELAAVWQPWAGVGDGLLLWRYVGGPWERVEEFAFGR